MEANRKKEKARYQKIICVCSFYRKHPSAESAKALEFASIQRKLSEEPLFPASNLALCRDV